MNSQDTQTFQTTFPKVLRGRLMGLLSEVAWDRVEQGQTTMDLELENKYQYLVSLPGGLPLTPAEEALARQATQ